MLFMIASRGDFLRGRIFVLRVCVVIAIAIADTLEAMTL